MHTLLLMRHAKSSWDDADLADDERPLNKRGKAAAAQMGKYLRQNRLIPDLIVTSSAKRARQTAKRLEEAGEFDTPIVKNERLYLNGPEAYLECIEATRPTIKTLLVLGHNPDMESLVSRFASEHSRMPTAAIARIEIKSENWRGVRDREDCKVVAVYRPKELANED